MISIHIMEKKIYRYQNLFSILYLFYTAKLLDLISAYSHETFKIPYCLCEWMMPIHIFNDCERMLHYAFQSTRAISKKKSYVNNLLFDNFELKIGNVQWGAYEYLQDIYNYIQLLYCLCVVWNSIQMWSNSRKDSFLPT